MQARDHFLELCVGPGCGQRRLAQMVVEIEFLLFNPAGMVKVVE